MTPFELSEKMDALLHTSAFRDDASNNGLQFDAGGTVRRIAFGVDGTLEFFSAAVQWKADLAVVHHGISWGGSLRRIDCINGARIGVLAENCCSLYASHLPLDSHPELGHNARLAEMVSLQNRKSFGIYHGFSIGFSGTLPEPVKAGQLAALMDRNLDHSHCSRVFGDPERVIRTVGIISGGGAWSDVFTEMKNGGIECLLTGEFTHQSVSYCREAGAEVIVMGHYRSECPGIRALEKWTGENFPEIETRFFDFPTGM